MNTGVCAGATAALGSAGAGRPSEGVSRRAADLSALPNLVVIYLGMRVYTLRGVATVLRSRRAVRDAVASKPEGLLFHESFYFSLWPLHIGLRQYWRDFDALEHWTRSIPHQAWWKEFVRDTRGTGIWHETYLTGNGIEGIYDGVRESVGLLHFAPAVAPVDTRRLARGRLNLK